MDAGLFLLLSGYSLLSLISPAAAQTEEAAMRGDPGAQVEMGLAHRRSAYVWLRVADHFKRDKSRVPNIFANQLEQQLQPEEVVEADREVERLIKEVEKNRPSLGELKKAAMQGDAEAQGELAWRYCLGDGVGSNPREAYKWAVVADTFGYAAVPGETLAETVESLNNTPDAVMSKSRADAQQLVEQIKKKPRGS